MSLTEFLHKFLIVIEYFASLTAVLYYKKLKNSYWKWFVIYLVIIFFNENFGDFICKLLNISRNSFYNYYGIPIQFIFFFWLYALKSFQSIYLFLTTLFIYLISLLLNQYLIENFSVFQSFSYLAGTILLFLLIAIEFIKQLRSSDIISFKENKMFYINLGVFLFYIGSSPFYSLYPLLKTENVNVWRFYLNLSLIFNCLMYSLFISSFIWGKQKSI